MKENIPFNIKYFSGGQFVSEVDMKKENRPSMHKHQPRFQHQDVARQMNLLKKLRLLYIPSASMNTAL
jgi:hypothetical protein